MAFGKNPRTDRKSTSYCSTVTLVVFVALCLVGVWMMTSSSIIPVPTTSVSTETKSELKERVPDTSQAFEDTPGDLPSDAIQGDNGNPSQEEKAPEVEEKVQEDPVQETQEKESKKEIQESDESTDKGDDREKIQEQEVEGGDQQLPQTEEKLEEKSNEPVTEEEKVELKDKVDEHNEEKAPDQSDDSKKQSESDGAGGQDSPDETPKDENQESPSEDKVKEKSPGEVLPDAAQSEILNETNIQTGTWKTQATESKNENDAQGGSDGYKWKLCNVTAGPDYIPCLDNEQAIKRLPSTKHYEHRERHCPDPAPTCLVPLPEGYRRPIEWPTSRDKIWYSNVPHTKLAQVKGHQNWVKVSGDHLIFPGGGTQFKNGAQHYIDFIQEIKPDIAWGKRTRVILDVGCGVASFGGYLFDNDVLAMSFAPKDEHEAQVQFALERGIPAISAVMGTQRLPFPSRVFDVVHCARCRVPWHIEGGMLLLELNRVLRPGGYFVWSATPVYQNKKNEEDAGIWKAMKKLTKDMCWDLKKVEYDRVNQVGAAIFKKPTSNDCYENRPVSEPPMCKESDEPNAAWYVPLQACMHKVPVASTERGSKWPEEWPLRLENPPYWLSTQTGVYGKAAPEDFTSDYEHWKRVVSKSYLKGLGINWSRIRNVMDMRAVYGGFAAALKDVNLWVMNVVPVNSADTLPIIYERGLFGIYHDWCESFNTYPRSYDLLHADHLFSKLKKCSVTSVVAEVDRILRPEGTFIVRDNVEIINQIKELIKSMKWEVRMAYSQDKEGLLCVKKSMWRPEDRSSM
ncbi:probable methyltransferase PMT26 [Nymphaea colorata]|nr:probable methyltransferase PMT26 [Nymphaea colorata]